MKNSCYWVVDLIRFILAFTFVGWIFLAESVLDISMILLAFLSYTTLAFYKYRCTRFVWNSLLKLPIVAWSMLGLLVLKWTNWKWCRKNRRQREVNPQNSRSLDNIDLGNNELNLRNLYMRYNIRDARNDQNIYYTSDNDVINNILKEWVIKFSLENQPISWSVTWWWVCLEQFNNKEKLVELHWAKDHIFHPHCIKHWAATKKTCPICRYDFVKIYLSEKKQEKEKLW